MTGSDYRAALSALRLTHGAAGAILGISARTSQRWAAGAGELPEGAAGTIRWMLAQRLTTKEMIDGFGVRDRISERAWRYAGEE